MLQKKRIAHKVPFPEPVRRSANYRPFLAVVGIIILVSFIGVLNQIEKATLTGHTVQTISYAKEGSELFFEVKTGGIKDATFHFAQDTKNAKIEIAEIDATFWKFEGKVYSRVKIASVQPIKLSSIDFTLKIKEQDLLNKGIAASDLQLFVNSKELETTLAKKEDGYLYYKATSAELGEYIIGSLPKKQVQLPVTGEAATEPAKKELGAELPAEEPVAPEEAQPLPIVTDSFWQKITRWFRELFI